MIDQVINTVTTRAIKASCVATTEDGGASIYIRPEGHNTVRIATGSPAGCPQWVGAADLRELAALFTTMADVLDGQK